MLTALSVVPGIGVVGWGARFLMTAFSGITAATGYDPLTGQQVEGPARFLTAVAFIGPVAGAALVKFSVAWRDAGAAIQAERDVAAISGAVRPGAIGAVDDTLGAIARDEAAAATAGGGGRAGAAAPVTTFYRGTTLGSALEVVEKQALEVERISINQVRYSGAAQSGVYMTSQGKTAVAFADLAGGGGAGLGPAVIRIDVDTQRWVAFAEAHGIPIETPVPRPLAIGQTETVIPFEQVPEFDAIATYSLHGGR